MPETWCEKMEGRESLTRQLQRYVNELEGRHNQRLLTQGIRLKEKYP